MGGSAVYPLSTAEGEILVGLAAAAVKARLIGTPINGWPPLSPTLRALGSSFVTLERDGALRGCVGTLDAARPLYRDVCRNAIRAMADPRVAPVTRDEWPTLAVSISVLSPSERVAARGLSELHDLLRPKVDGLVVAAGGRQATFLPTVWRKLPDPVDFVAALLAKGGWEDDHLPDDVRLLRYTALEYHDHGTHHPL
jgi:uncharacterized protein